MTITCDMAKIFEGVRIEIHTLKGTRFPVVVYGDVLVSPNELFVRVKGHLLDDDDELICGDILVSVVERSATGLCAFKITPRKPDIDETYTTHSVGLKVTQMEKPTNKNKAKGESGDVGV